MKSYVVLVITGLLRLSTTTTPKEDANRDNYPIRVLRVPLIISNVTSYSYFDTRNALKWKAISRIKFQHSIKRQLL